MKQEIEPTALQYTTVDHIPLIWTEPNNSEPVGVVIWLPGFSGTKEAVIPQLIDLTKEGYFAISFDPYQHGKRKQEKQDALVQRVVGNIRRYFWPILTLTAEEFPRIIDWAIQRKGKIGNVMVGGISMGGDIAVAAAGVDDRIVVVAACIATPDWLRPGSHEPPGKPDMYSLACYERRNPLTNLEAFRHQPALSFQCGELDTQVPAEAADRFIKQLKQTYIVNEQKLEVIKHKGVAHHFTPEMWQNCLQWFHKHKENQ